MSLLVSFDQANIDVSKVRLGALRIIGMKQYPKGSTVSSFPLCSPLKLARQVESTSRANAVGCCAPAESHTSLVRLK